MRDWISQSFVVGIAVPAIRHSDHRRFRTTEIFQRKKSEPLQRRRSDDRFPAAGHNPRVGPQYPHDPRDSILHTFRTRAKFGAVLRTLLYASPQEMIGVPSSSPTNHHNDSILRSSLDDRFRRACPPPREAGHITTFPMLDTDSLATRRSARLTNAHTALYALRFALRDLLHVVRECIPISITLPITVSITRPFILNCS